MNNFEDSTEAQQIWRQQLNVDNKQRSNDQQIQRLNASNDRSKKMNDPTRMYD